MTKQEQIDCLRELVKELKDASVIQALEYRQNLQELEAENARLRQQRDAANAQLDFVLENTKCDTSRKAIEHTRSI